MNSHLKVVYFSLEDPLFPPIYRSQLLHFIEWKYIIASLIKRLASGLVALHEQSLQLSQIKSFDNWNFDVPEIHQLSPNENFSVNVAVVPMAIGTEWIWPLLIIWESKTMVAIHWNSEWIVYGHCSVSSHTCSNTSWNSNLDLACSL